METRSGSWRTGYQTMFVLFIALLIAYIDRVNASILIVDPKFLKDMGITDRPDLRGLLFSVFLWAYGSAALILSSLLDKIGARKGLIVVAVIWSLAMVVGGIAWVFPIILLSRVILGLGEGLQLPMNSMVVKHWAPPRERGIANSISNVGIYFGFIDEVEYMAGMTAGLMTRTGRMGFVAAKPIPQVLRNINSFMLGARSVNPSVTMRVVFTGDWVLPVREAEASSSLADQGVDVLTGHTGSPRVIVQVAERRGIFATGYQFNQSVLAPHGFLTGAEWAWEVVYHRYAELIHAGNSVATGTIPRRMAGTLKDEFCRLSPFGPAVTAEKREAIARAKQRLLDGSHVVYRGPLRDNAGKTVIPAGTTIRIEDPVLDQMNWLVEGVQGQVST